MGPLKSRTALPGCQLVPMGVGQQLDRVERKSWRYPQPWWPPSEKDETGLGHPRHPGGFLPLGIHWGESLAWPVRALVYSAILEMGVFISVFLGPQRPWHWPLTAPCPLSFLKAAKLGLLLFLLARILA